MVARDAVGLPVELGPLLLLSPRQAHEHERREEDLAEVGGHQVVQDRVDG